MNNPFSASHSKNMWQSSDDDDDIDEQFMSGVEKTLKSSVDSTNRALAAIYDSEKLGNATAMELARQREKLENADRKLTEIDNTTTQTQQKLNNIDSVWYSLKKGNLFSSKKDKDKNKKTKNTNKDISLHIEKASDNKQGSNPFGNSPEITTNHTNNSKNENTCRKDGYLNQRDENISKMSDGVSRLAAMAKNLGQELDEHDAILDRIKINTDKQKNKIDAQNKKMSNILK
ncbi:hypothetical protein A3Q56_01499 [Intoshia linei]|uniref:t-SNARE coiled-coil homology domain-containing protein n=1 Tax=Intoshia linei TaxID=1819745 RepID=A0A177B900_9BILA|nr:hypothetical protein A3Q56_01499 [Intoshia linei]